MKVLVTGATGRVGSHLTANLAAEGHSVVALVMPGDPGVDRIRPDTERIVSGTLDDSGALVDAVDCVDAVCHLASTLPTRGHGDRESFTTILGGTFNLLEAIREHSPAISRFVTVSTAGVYIGDRTGGPHFLPVDETHKLETSNVYSAAKLGAEYLALMYWRAYQMPVSIVRPTDTAEAWEFTDKSGFLGKRFFLSGHLSRMPADPASDVEAEMCQQLLRLADGDEKVITLQHPGSGGRMITLNDARDAAAGLALALKAPDAVGEAFNIGPADSYHEDEVGKHLAERLGLEHHSIEAQLIPDWTFSSRKAQAILGYRPKRTVFDMIDEAAPRADLDAIREISTDQGGAG